MKTFIHKSIIFSVMALMLWSCKKDEVKVVAPDQGTGGSLKTSATAAIILDKANDANNAITFDMSAANFGFNAATKNTLQIAVAGSSFAAPKNVTLDTKATALSYTVFQLNQLVLTLDLPFDSATELEARVKSEVSDKLSTAYSNVVKFSVKPYPLTSYVYAPGNYQGWSPPTANSLVSPLGNGIYSGVINFPANADNNYEFKITPAKNWDIAYGDAGGGKYSTSGGNFKAPAAGVYLVGLDTKAGTYSIAPYSWGIIGAATPTGWDSDTDMAYDNATATWSITIALKTGDGTNEFKFRLNNLWDVNLGGSGGTLTFGGGNIKTTEAGTYKIVLDVNKQTYTITKQ